MLFIDTNNVAQISKEEFQNAKQFPWISIRDFLKKDALQNLINDLPTLQHMERSEGIQRPYGQESHDRFYLQYEQQDFISDSWKKFIDELNGKEYKKFLKKFFSLSWYEDIDLYFHWHYAKNGNSVSPHCDGKAKLGSQLFYLNTEQDWNNEWGGQTMVLIDQNKKFDCKSAPSFSDFDEQIMAMSMAPWSFIFARTDASWHGVKKINAPEGALRKIFIVVFEKRTPIEKFNHLIFGAPKRVGY